MKRWKITGPKQEIVTCENCEEGREFVCTHPENTQKLIRIRSGDSLFTSNKYLTGTASCYTFIRYLDPDPETPKQVRFADVGFGEVFVTDRTDVVFWKSVLVVWFAATGTGEVAIWDLDSWNNSDIVTLTGQTAELVEDE